MKRFVAVVLAALIASPATAARFAGSDTAFLKTRVRGINLAAHPRVGASSAASCECVWGISLVGLEVAAASTEYPLLDALNSVMAITDASGQVVREYQYDVYGARISSTGAGPDVDRGYTGRYHDSNGVVDHRDRLRRPREGFSGWMSEDRWNLREILAGTSFTGVGIAGSLPSTVDGANRFGYALGNPVQHGDPLGLFEVNIPGAAVGAAIGAVTGAYVGHFICGGSAATGAVIGALLGALLGAGLGSFLNLRLILKVLPTFAAIGKFELNLVSTLGRIWGVGWKFGAQAFHWNFGGGHVFGFGAYFLTLLAIAVVLGAIFLIVMDLRIEQAKKASTDE